MVFWTNVQTKDTAAGHTYQNEVYRHKYGFKELHVHNPPKRRNKDFKPVLYGDFIGMLNFKLSEPWALMRHAKDLLSESHHKPINLAKQFIKGFVVGSFLGFMQMQIKFNNEFLMRKLYLTIDKGPFTFKTYRYLTQVVSYSGFAGGALFLSYQLLWDFFTHHKHAMEVPDIITHFKIWVVLVPLVTAYTIGPGFIPHTIGFSLLMGFPAFMY